MSHTYLKPHTPCVR